MIGFAEKVIAYTDGFDQTGFVASSLNYDATVRNLELTGEAATHIPGAVRAANPQIPWRLIIATRNRLIHGYLGIDNDTASSGMAFPHCCPNCEISRNSSGERAIPRIRCRRPAADP